jgi:hypothetical protein
MIAYSANDYASVAGVAIALAAIAVIVLPELWRRRRRRAPVDEMVDEARREAPEIHASAAAVDHIRKRGGSLWIWGDPTRSPSHVLVSWRTQRPDREMEFDVLPQGRFVVHLDSQLDVGDWVTVKLVRFPIRSLTLDWQRSVGWIGGGAS